MWSVAKNQHFSDVVIITPNKILLEFLNKMQIKYIEIDTLVDYSLKGLKAHKHTLDMIALQIFSHDIYFEHIAHDYWGLYLMYMLRKTNKVYFDYPLSVCPIRNTILDTILEKNSRTVFKENLIRYFVTGVRFNVLRTPNNPIVGIHLKRIYRLFKFLKIEYNHDIFIKNRQLVADVYKLSIPQIVLADQGDILYSYPEALTGMISELAKEFRILLKQHPRLLTKDKVLLASLDKVPTEIPMELLISEETVIVGIASAFLRDFNSISLIRLVDFYNEEKREYYYNFIKTDNVQIPETPEEFIKLIRDRLLANS